MCLYGRSENPMDLHANPHLDRVEGRVRSKGEMNTTEAKVVLVNYTPGGLDDIVAAACYDYL